MGGDTGIDSGGSSNSGTSSKDGEDVEDFQEFLKMLQGHFKGRGCYLSLYDQEQPLSASSQQV